MSALLTTKREWAARIVAECVRGGGLDDMLDEIIDWEFNRPIPYIMAELSPVPSSISTG